MAPPPPHLLDQLGHTNILHQPHSVTSQLKMATKLTILTALTITLLVGSTLAYHESRRQDEGCRRQGQGRMHLRPCQMYLRQQSRGGWDISISEDDVSSNQQQQHLQQCCQLLRPMEEECRCHCLRDIVEQQEMEMEMDEERGQIQRMRQQARNLPAMCGLRQRQCDF